MQLEALELHEDQYRVGNSKVFFPAGVLAKLEEDRENKLSTILTAMQARIRGTLSRM